MSTPQGPHHAYPQGQQPYGQPPSHAQPHGAPSYPGPPPEGIAVTTKWFPLYYTLLIFKPKIAVDGYELPYAVWGRNVIPAPPGRHHVHVHVPTWLPARWGPADTTVDVYPGRFVEVEYLTPAFYFGPGSLGPAPQKYNGVGLMIAFTFVPFVLTILMVGVMFIFSFLAAKP